VRLTGSIARVAGRFQSFVCEVAEALDSGRLFSCASCRRQVVVCQRCDRGQRYCSQECSAAARAESIRRSSSRHQKTAAGAGNHARRQHRYRQRILLRAACVTHQGSPEEHAAASIVPAVPDTEWHEPALSLPPERKQLAFELPTFSARPGRCHLCSFCRRLCTDALRFGFLTTPRESP
jgi:hypothetical protein